MTRVRTVMVGLLVAAVLIALWVAIYLSLRARPGEAAVDDCGPVSTRDQQSLLWLMHLRQNDGLPLAEISLLPCESGTRDGATAFVEPGGSVPVKEFFATRHDCDVQRSCWVATEAGPLWTRLSLSPATVGT